MSKISLKIYEAVHISIFTDHPNKDLEVFLGPVLLYFSILQHLVNPASNHPHNSLVAYVTSYHPTSLVELRAVNKHIRTQLALPVLMESLYKFNEFLLGFNKSLHRNGALNEFIAYCGLLRLIYVLFYVRE